MDDANRFAPPGTVVDDVRLTSDVQRIRFWPPTGRIGRLRFLAYSLGVYAAFLILSGLLGLIAAATHRGAGFAAALGIASLVIYLAAAVVLLIQRSHDMDLSGWWSIAACVPLVGLLWVFKGGTQGGNRWGAPPPPNTTAVRVIGLLLPAVFVVGIVAAIAIPAYHAYSTRAIAGAPSR